MLSIGPSSGFISFSPLNEQIEFAWSGASVGTPEPEPGTPGVPGGPITSPAKAALALPPTTAVEQTATAHNNFFVLPIVQLLNIPVKRGTYAGGDDVVNTGRHYGAPLRRYRASQPTAQIFVLDG